MSEVESWGSGIVRWPRRMMGLLRAWGRPGTVALVLGLVLLPLTNSSYYLSLVTEVLIFAIFAMSLDLLLGYTGLPSFGHTAFFGLGAYAVGYIAAGGAYRTGSGLTANLLLTVPAVIAVAALAALIIGFLVLRTTGIYFLMLTLAIAQMLFGLAIKWTPVTGGSDGLAGVPRPYVGIGPLIWKFGTSVSFYYLVLAFFLFSWWALHRLVDSPFGRTLIGIKANESRMRALGYNTWRFKMAAFVIAGAFAGLAGQLFAHFNWHAAPENLYWTMSGQALIMVIIGGAGSLGGPALGALLVRLVPTLYTNLVQFVWGLVGAGTPPGAITERWQTLLGLIFIAFVLFAPRGIIGLIQGLELRRGPRWPLRGLVREPTPADGATTGSTGGAKVK